MNAIHCVSQMGNKIITFKNLISKSRSSFGRLNDFFYLPASKKGYESAQKPNLVPIQRQPLYVNTPEFKFFDKTFGISKKIQIFIS